MIPWLCAQHQHCCSPGGGRTTKADEADTHLSPDQLPNANKQAPEPLLRGQGGAAEGLSTKLDDDNLQERGGREAGPADTPTDTTPLLQHWGPILPSRLALPPCTETQRGCWFSQGDGFSRLATFPPSVNWMLNIYPACIYWTYLVLDTLVTCLSHLA